MVGTMPLLCSILSLNAVTNKIKVGNAPDAVLYEPTKKRVYAFNAHSHSASVIDAQTEQIVATVPLSGIPEFATTDGQGNVFVNIENKSTLVRFNADGTNVQNEWSLAPCKGPSGLAMDAKGRRLFSVCDNKFMIVTDADTGKRIAQIPVGVEPDAAIYDVEKKLVFASNCDGTLTVVRQESPDKYSVAQTLDHRTGSAHDGSRSGKPQAFLALRANQTRIKAARSGRPTRIHARDVSRDDRCAANVAERINDSGGRNVDVAIRAGAASNRCPDAAAIGSQRHTHNFGTLLSSASLIG